MTLMRDRLINSYVRNVIKDIRMILNTLVHNVHNG